MAAAEGGRFMDGFVAAKEAADAAETHATCAKKTCICMHTLCATSDPHEFNGQGPGSNKPKVGTVKFRPQGKS